MFQSLPGNLGVPAKTVSSGVIWNRACFNPFQGIWEFRLRFSGEYIGIVESFQSLPGNLGVPAKANGKHEPFEASFNPFQGIWEFRLTTTFSPMMLKSGMFQSLPGNLGVPAHLKIGIRLFVAKYVSIPSREFGSSGGHDDLIGAIDANLFQSLPGNLGVPAC